jgi:isopentenyl-diphosphate delta-isomerase
MLLQQRAEEKYHSAGLWTNSCCSHPRPGEDTMAAAKRRLLEEMGIDTELRYKTSLLYKTETGTPGFENGLTEHEFDHIFTAVYDSDPVLNKEEAKDFRWMSISAIRGAIKKEPEHFTFWFKVAFDRFFSSAE